MTRNNKTQNKNGNSAPNGAKVRRKKRLWVIVPLLVITAAAFILAGWMRKPGEDGLGNTGATFEARKDELIVTVTETGSIKAQKSTEIMCDVGGRGIEIATIVPEGTVITQEDVDRGMILCELNSSDLEDYYSREKTELSTDQAAYLEAQEAHLIQLKQNESDIATAQLAVEFGMLDLQNYVGKTAAEKLVVLVEDDPNSTIEMSVLMEFLAEPNSLGGEALQTLKQHQDTPLDGEVTTVSPLPDPPRGWLDPGVKVYTTKVAIKGKHDIIKPGMSAKVEILVDHLYDVTIVPVQGDRIIASN